MRNFQFLIQDTGPLSYTDRVASMAFDSGDAVYPADATVAGPATVVTADLNDAAIAALDGYELLIGDGTNIERIVFAAGGINTLAEFQGALDGLAVADAAHVGGVSTLTAAAGKSIQIDATNAAVFAGLGVTEGWHQPTIDAPAGWALIKAGLTDDQLAAGGIICRPVMKGVLAPAVTALAYVDGNYVNIPDGLEATVKAAFGANGKFVKFAD